MFKGAVAVLKKEEGAMYRVRKKAKPMKRVAGGWADFPAKDGKINSSSNPKTDKQ